MTRTAFFHDEKTLWHAGGSYVLTAPVGGFVQPPSAGGLPESPETKRRLINLMTVTGLMAEVDLQTAPPAPRAALEAVHPARYLDAFQALSDAGGGEMGLRTPFGPGAYEIAALSAGLASGALTAVLRGTARNAYALSRPPGHHCLPDWPNGFCLLNNIAIAIEAARTAGLAQRFLVLDWDVHHGNGTEHIFYARDDVATISIHQERNYPLDTGAVADRGRGPGLGHNINIPLTPGGGDDTYLYAYDTIVRPAIAAFRPDVIIVACGFDASGVDPLSRMLVSAAGFRSLTDRVMADADALCDGRLVLVHEGGYSEVHVPFCGHATIAALAGSDIDAPDPLANRLAGQQPGAQAAEFYRSQIDAMAAVFAQPP